MEFVINYNDYGDIVSQVELHNLNGDVVGYCLDFDNAYLIYDKIGNVIEHSPETNSPFYNYVGTAYYGGPLLYLCKDDNNNFIDINTNEQVPLDFLLELPLSSKDYSSYTKNYRNKPTTYSIGYNVETYYTDYSPYCLNCNDDGECGVLAAAILFMYYQQHITDGFVNQSFMNSPVTFYNYLLNNYIQTSGDYPSLINGMNAYMRSKNISNIATCVNSGFHNYLVYKIKRCKEPVILGLYDNGTNSGWSIDHWVVAYGYREYFMDGQSYNIEYIVNDGWGHNQVFITYSTDYMDGVVSFAYTYSN